MRQTNRTLKYHRTDVASIAFIKQKLQSGERNASFVPGESGISVTVYVENDRFRPIVGKDYDVKIGYRWSKLNRPDENGADKVEIGYATALNLELLQPGVEYLTLEQAAEDLSPTLRFWLEAKRNGEGQTLLSRHKGRIVKPAPGVTFPVDEDVRVLLEGRGNHYIAYSLTEEEQISTTALVKRAVAEGVITDEELRVVEYSREQKDGSVTVEFRNIYEFLSFQGDSSRPAFGVNASSPEKDITKAYRLMVSVSSSDALGAKVGGVASLHPRMVRNANLAVDALTKAKDNALELLKRHTAAVAAESASADGTAKADKPKRQPRERGGKGRTKRAKAPRATGAQVAAAEAATEAAAPAASTMTAAEFFGTDKSAE